MDVVINDPGEDEPVFVLRARDRCAPAAVRAWAERARGSGEVPQAKIDGAMDVAVEMERWAKLHGSRWPD